MMSRLPENNTLNTTNSLGTNDLCIDAWGRQKTVNDYSLFHGVWTYDVPNRIWEEYSIASGTYTALTATGTLAMSSNNMLSVSSGTTAGNGCAVKSKRNPRYQPNRGHLYSTAVILPNADGDGRRRFGLFTVGTSYDSGVYFELEGTGSAWTLYAVRKTHGSNSTRQDLSSYLPAGFDPEKGHVYDIQYQWRGVGNYKFFIDLQEIYVDSILGTLTDLSMRMPALPAAFESVTDTTTALELKVGCVDITSEGGKTEGKQLLTVNTGPLSTAFHADAVGTMMVAIKNPRTISYGGNTIPNTRDVVLGNVSAWVRDEASVYIYFARDTVATNIDGLTFTTADDSVLEYLTAEDSDTTEQTAFQTDDSNMTLLAVESNDTEIKNSLIYHVSDSAPIYITPGDIAVIAAAPLLDNQDVTITVYLAEEI